MKSILRQRRKSSILSAVVCILVGAVLIAFPQDSVRWMCMLLGAVLTAAGVWNLVSYFRGGSVLSVFQLDLLLGIVLTLFGAWLLLWPDSVLALLQYVFGAFVIMHGLVQMQAALEIRGGPLPVLLALLAIVCGIVIIIDPFATMSALIVLIGAVLIYNGIIELYLIVRLSRAAAHMERELEHEYVDEKANEPPYADERAKARDVDFVDVEEDDK